MSDIHEAHTALGDVAARTLSNATKTVPMMGTITPRWLVHLLQWIPVEAGIYRVNKVKSDNKVCRLTQHRTIISICGAWIFPSSMNASTATR